jgi:ubiquinone/menaquinone biosynthesis C-methylase UbiE
MSPPIDQKKFWSDSKVAERYANAENATRPFASLLVSKANLAASTSDLHILDLATGTGVTVLEVYDAVPRERWNKVCVLGGDVSESMLAYLRARGEKEGWTGLKTEVLDGNVSF